MTIMLLWKTAEMLEDKMYKMSFNVVWLSLLLVPLFALTVYATDRDALIAFLTMLAALSPLWLPVILLGYLWISWLHYARHLFWFGADNVLLEIQLPPQIEKSPMGIELFLSSIFHTGSETTFINRIWQGKFRNTWSLEIASIEGHIGFYIHCRRIWRNAVESRIYGQYPEAKITEVEDYIAKIPYNNHEWDMWCGEYGKKGKAWVAPIKTYEEFELTEELDEPKTRTDPITNLLEVFGLMGKGEYVWMQIVMRAHAKEDWFGMFKFGDAMKENAHKRINEIVAEAAERAKHIAEHDLKFKEEAVAQVTGRGMTMLTEEEREEIKLIERNLGKFIFECGIRVVYVARKENFKGINGAFLFRLFDAYRGPFNTIGGIPGRGMIGFDYPWEDPLGFRRNRIKDLYFFHSKHRAYFYVPYDQKPEFLSVEELATIWHFPNTGVETPGLNRVAAKVSEAPHNLPGASHH
jgi:hypothetical protein